MATVEATEVFVLLSDGTLNKGLQLAGESEVRTFESDNLDDAGMSQYSEEEPTEGVVRKCERCFWHISRSGARF